MTLLRKRAKKEREKRRERKRKRKEKEGEKKKGEESRRYPHVSPRSTVIHTGAF